MEVVMEKGRWLCHGKVEKWHNYQDAEEILLARLRGETPDEVVEVEGNALLTAGITRMLNLLIAAGGQGLDNTHARIGVGDGSTGVTIADTDLSAAAGSTHRYFMTMDATYPQVASNVVTFRATFGAGDGNFAWNEFGIDAGTAGGTTVTAPLLNRKVSSLGTKAGGSWQFTVTITIT